MNKADVNDGLGEETIAIKNYMRYWFNAIQPRMLLLSVAVTMQRNETDCANIYNYYYLTHSSPSEDLRRRGLSEDARLAEDAIAENLKLHFRTHPSIKRVVEQLIRRGIMRPLAPDLADLSPETILIWKDTKTLQELRKLAKEQAGINGYLSSIIYDLKWYLHFYRNYGRYWKILYWIIPPLKLP